MPPRCTAACTVPQRCRHASAAPCLLPTPSSAAPSTDPSIHRCHFGPCPPCVAPCGTPLPCGHICAAQQCHDPPPPPVGPFEKPAAPSTSALLQLLQQEQQQAQAGSGLFGGQMKRGGGAGGEAADISPCGPSAVSRAGGEATDISPCGHSAVSRAVQQSALVPGGRLLSPCPPCAVAVPVTCLGRCAGEGDAWPC